MNPDFWHERWHAEQIGFHRDGVHPDLIENEGWFLANGPHTVLVPLCGKSHDLHWLAARGHQVVGIELVEKAVRDFFAEQGLSPEVEDTPHGKRFQAGNIRIEQGDAIAIIPTLTGITRVWDRAAMVALPPEPRTAYTAALGQLLSRGASMLLNVLHYDQSVMSGPPFSVGPDEVRRCYPENFSVEQLAQRDMIADEPRWRERGHTFWNIDLYRIEGPS